MGRGEHGVQGTGHAGEHEQAVGPGPDRALDVGVEAVADHERAAGAGARHGLGVQWRLGLARDQRLLAGRGGYHA